MLIQLESSICKRQLHVYRNAMDWSHKKIISHKSPASLTPSYNAGQKKRNSELRIFRAPPEWGGLTLNTVHHTQGNFKTACHFWKRYLPLPGSSQKIHGSELRFFWPALYNEMQRDGMDWAHKKSFPTNRRHHWPLILWTLRILSLFHSVPSYSA